MAREAREELGVMRRERDTARMKLSRCRGRAPPAPWYQSQQKLEELTLVVARLDEDKSAEEKRYRAEIRGLREDFGAKAAEWEHQGWQLRMQNRKLMKERGVQSQLLCVLRSENRKLKKDLEKERALQSHLRHVLNGAGGEGGRGGVV